MCATIAIINPAKQELTSWKSGIYVNVKKSKEEDEEENLDSIKARERRHD